MKTNNMLKSFSMLDNLIIQFVEKMIGEIMIQK